VVLATDSVYDADAVERQEQSDGKMDFTSTDRRLKSPHGNINSRGRHEFFKDFIVFKNMPAERFFAIGSHLRGDTGELCKRRRQRSSGHLYQPQERLQSA
jgi:hypothetical protein